MRWQILLCRSFPDRLVRLCCIDLGLLQDTAVIKINWLVELSERASQEDRRRVDKQHRHREGCWTLSHSQQTQPDPTGNCGIVCQRPPPPKYTSWPKTQCTNPTRQTVLRWKFCGNTPCLVISEDGSFYITWSTQTPNCHELFVSKTPAVRPHSRCEELSVGFTDCKYSGNVSPYELLVFHSSLKLL
jgi:hypothetical protein